MEKKSKKYKTGILESYCFHKKMRLLNEEFEQLRANPEAWQQEMNDRNELEGSIQDGLEN